MFAEAFRSSLLRYLFPFRCGICDHSCSEVASYPEAEGTQPILLANALLCERCNRLDELLLPRPLAQEPCCMRCSEPLRPGESGDTCLLCRLFPLPLDALHSLFVYDGAIELLIKRYKYFGRRPLGAGLGTLLSASYTEWLLRSLPDVIIPLPSSARALQARGFHHIAPLAKEIGRQIRRPVLVFALRSVGERRAQALLSPEQRARNIRQRFRASPKAFEGRSVLIVDDIVTTGMSLQSAAFAIREAGASRVEALTLARSRHFVHHRLKLALAPHAKMSEGSRKTSENRASSERDGERDTLRAAPLDDHHSTSTIR